ncbi:pilus assembly protein TadG-related protein [Prosthecomicrobium sp. N25]|uniref:pilus assembly protein TadG-related protein n=1 Tax=Prosthecomicrobium sp. N25 TaxID=3129254 RepID=UPI003077732A
MTRSLFPALTDFARDERGSIAATFGGALLGIMVTTGVAVDYSRAAAVRSEMQGAADAASLATARAIAAGESDTKKLQAVARSIFDANMRADIAETVKSADFKVVTDLKTKTASVKATAHMKTVLIGIAGVDVVDLGVSSDSTVDGTKFEIAMMVDMTGSMASKPKAGGPTKIASLKSASTDFINTLLPANGANKEVVRIGVVPFAASVNAGAYAAAVSGGKSTACVTERYLSGVIDSSDASGKVSPVGVSAAADCPANKVRPLTNDRTALLADVSAFTASGTTAGHLGTIWARYVLSAKWSDVWTGAAASATGAKGVRKVAILMTDGLYNTSYGTTGKQTVVEPNPASMDAALAACGAMNKEGITVYTIGFDLTGASGTWAKKMLEDCASTITDQNGVKRKAFYDAADGAALKAAYDEIAAQILKIRLSS